MSDSYDPRLAMLNAAARPTNRTLYGGQSGEIPNYDNYGQPVSPTISGEGSAPVNRPAYPANGQPYGFGAAGSPPPPPPQGGNGIAPNGQPMPPGDFPGNVQGQDLGVPPGTVIYEDGSVGADPNQTPGGSTAQAPVPGATPTTGIAAALGFPQSQWSLALQQRMANGGIGNPMDFYNFVRNRGVMPTPDQAAPAAQMARAPRPLVIGPTNNSPAQIIPQQAASGPGGMPMPPAPPMPQVAQPQQPAIQRPITPGQVPGGVPQNPQMPGFFPQGRGVR